MTRLRLRMSIFLDQMSRNVVAIRRGSEASQAAIALREACDAAAVPLALSVIAEIGGAARGDELLRIANPAELCFLSLVLRHTHHPAHLSISHRLVHGAAEALRRRGRALGIDGVVTERGEEWKSGAFELFSRFQAETQDAIAALKVEAYLRRALSSDEPLPFAILPQGPLPRYSVLDARCLRLWPEASGGPTFLGGLLQQRPGDGCAAAPAERFRNHHLVAELQRALEELGLLRADRGIVLSLSGGVDSMVTCCLLWLLRLQLPRERRFRWCAMHLCHPNRADASDEEGWVRWACTQLGVDAFTYRLEIRRPHGNLRTGITRDRYEEKSKELRFRMYARCLAHMGVAEGCGAALVAHHQDDADENRLAELGKGNIVHIDGMSQRGAMLGVEVVRPLLGVRKAELIAFADEAGVCYMRDSTPLWSRRGWIRRTLDGIAAAEPEGSRGSLLAALRRAGASSDALGDALDASLRGWKGTGVVPAVLEMAATPLDASPSGTSSVDVVLLRLDEILRLAADPDLAATIGRLRADITEIAAPWNKAIEAHRAAEASGNGTVAKAKGQDEGSSDDEGDADGPSGPGLCPLQPISIHASGLDVGPFLFCCAIYAAANNIAPVQRLLRGLPIARKALRHLWDSISRARMEYQWGALHKRCPCLYLRDANCLVLCDAEGREKQLANTQWQRSFANAALQLARQQDWVIVR